MPTKSAPRQWTRVLYIVLALFPFIHLFATTPFGNERFTQRLFAYGVCLFVGVGTILLHELVHAVSAWGLGGTVFHFTVGQGPLLWKTTIGDTDIAIHAIPMSGFVRVGFPTATAICLKTIIVTAAPMVMHLVIAIAVYTLVGPRLVLSPLFNSLFFINFGFFLLNALPYCARVGPQRVRVPSDGAHLLALLKEPALSHTLVTQYYSLRATRAEQAI